MALLGGTCMPVRLLTIRLVRTDLVGLDVRCQAVERFRGCGEP